MGVFKGCLWGFVSVGKLFFVPLPIQNIYPTIDYGLEGFIKYNYYITDQNQQIRVSVTCYGHFYVEFAMKNISPTLIKHTCCPGQVTGQ